jgi:hypothetical protein
MKKCFTEDGVGGIAQTNHLGPYTLTRLLEQKVRTNPPPAAVSSHLKNNHCRKS